MDNAEQGNETTPLVTKKVAIEESLAGHLDRLPSVLDDALDTVKLGVPIFIAMLSWVGVSRMYGWLRVFREIPMLIFFDSRCSDRKPNR
jgi:hypothetical protein